MHEKSAFAIVLTVNLLLGVCNTMAQSVPPDANTGLDEIVVTAERQESTLQRTSVIVDSYSGAELSGLTRPIDLTSLAPGVQIGAVGPNLQVYIRGVGDAADNSRSQGAVPFNIDGFYIARGNAAEASFFDINRVEILKGPQGTLYGRNASGGAINILSNVPDLSGTYGNVGGEIGNYNLGKVDGAVNIALSDTLAIRGAFQAVDRDGYTSTGGNDVKIRAGRIRGLWQPDDDLSLLLNVDASHVGGIGAGAVVLPQSGGNPWRSNTANPLPWPYFFSPDTAPFSTPTDSSYDNHVWGVSAELNWKTPIGTLTVMPGHRVQDQTYVTYPSLFRYAEDATDKQDTVEIRLANDIKLLKWVVGYYFYIEEPQALSEPMIFSFGNAVNYNERIEANAVFGQTTIRATDTLRFIAGIRYTDERNTATYLIGDGASPLIPFTQTGGEFSIAPIKSSRVNWKGGIEYDVAPQSMAFATAATGFKAGGYASTPSCGPDIFKPETLTAFELGLRNRFLNNTLQVNAEAFRWKYKDQQISDVTLDNCGEQANLTFNVGDSTITGGSVEAVWKVAAPDTLNLSVEYAHGTYNSFNFTQFGAGVYSPGGGSRCSATPGNAGLFTIDCAGQQITRLPEWSGVSKYEHVFSFSNFGDITAAITANFATARWLDVSYLPTGQAAGYVRENATLGYSAPNHRWSATAFIDNISNRAVYTSGNAIGVPSPNGYSYYAAYIDPPRMFGLRLRATF